MKLPKLIDVLPGQASDMTDSSVQGTKPERGLALQFLVNTATRTDQQWLNQTCLDARTVPNLAYVRLDNTWHNDNRAPQYGQHLTMSLYDNNDTRLDTCHVYQERTAGGCQVTFCQNNYGGYGVPDGNGFYGYFVDTDPT